MPQLYKHLTTCKSRQFSVLIFIFHCHSIHTVLEGTFSRWQVSNNKQLNKGLQWLKSQSLSNRSPAFEPGQQMLCKCQIYAVCAFLLRCGNLKFHHVKDCIYFTHSTNLCNLTTSRDINFTKIQMINFFLAEVLPFILTIPKVRSGSRKHRSAFGWDYKSCCSFSWLMHYNLRWWFKYETWFMFLQFVSFSACLLCI